MPTKRYVAEQFEVPSHVEGIPFTVRVRLLLDREGRFIRAVRSAHVCKPDGSRLPTTDDAYIDDQTIP